MAYHDQHRIRAEEKEAPVHAPEAESGGLGELKRMMDSEEVGGAPLLGAAKPVIKAHGSSHAKGIKNAIRQAKLCVANDLCGTMQTALAAVAEKAEAEKAEPVKE